MLERFKVPEADRVYVMPEKMHRVTKEIFLKVGLDEDAAQDSTDVLLGNDLRGNESHGVYNYMQIADQHSLLVILIEDIIAYKNLDEILEVDNIDVFFVAPSDFAASMGHTGNPNHPEVVETMNDAFLSLIHI